MTPSEHHALAVIKNLLHLAEEEHEIILKKDYVILLLSLAVILSILTDCRFNIISILCSGCYLYVIYLAIKDLINLRNCRKKFAAMRENLENLIRSQQ